MHQNRPLEFLTPVTDSSASGYLPIGRDHLVVALTMGGLS
jgi:hypothetical protein